MNTKQIDSNQEQLDNLNEGIDIMESELFKVEQKMEVLLEKRGKIATDLQKLINHRHRLREKIQHGETPEKPFLF